MELLNRIEHPETLTYPTNCTVGIFNSTDDAEDAILSLERVGFRESEMRLLEGEEGREAIDINNSQQSLVPRLIRMAEKLLDTGEWTFLETVDNELQQGHLMLSVLTDNPESKDKAVGVLHLHGAHTVKFFSRYYVEHFDAD